MKKHKLTLERITRAVRRDDMTGFCIECGVTVKPVEPDAERVRCSRCGKDKVFGAEQLLLMVQP